MALATQAREVLAIQEFRRFLAVRTLLMVASMMVAVVIGWQVWDLTHNALYLGYAGLAEFIPNFLFALPAGQLADRHDRRTILLACIAVFTVSISILLFNSLLPEPSVMLIFAISAVTGLARAATVPANQSLLPLLVPDDLFPRAVAITATAMKVSTIIGPMMGGFLIVGGAALPYGVGVIMMGMSLITCLRYPPLRTVNPSGTTGLQGLLEGIRFVRSQPVILGSISLDLFAVLLGGATALLPVYASDILHVGGTGLGLLRAAPGVGSALMAVGLSFWPLERHVGPKLFISVAVYGAATVVFGLSTWLPLSLVALMVMGAGDMISVVTRSTLVQIRTPNAMRGRVSAINWVFIGASNELGEFESGLTAAWFGTVPAVVLGGAGTLVVVGLWMVLFPALRQADKMRGDG